MNAIIKPITHSSAPEKQSIQVHPLNFFFFFQIKFVTNCHRPTAPECPLYAILFLKLIGDEEVQDRTQARETQSQTETQGKLLAFEPAGCDAVLQN